MSPAREAAHYNAAHDATALHPALHPALRPAAARDFAAPAVAFTAGTGLPAALARALWLFSHTRF